jgi:hypothetical protein
MQSKLSDYNTVFRNKIIPENYPGHNYYDANNLGFTEKLSDIEPNLMVIDSSSRNWDKEEPNNYTVHLGDHFQYVHSIELIEGYVPSSGYLINQHNNLLHFRETAHLTITATINPGDYEITTLVNLVADAMTAVSPHNYLYQCLIDPATHRVSISTNHKFKLILADGEEVVGDRGMMEILVVDTITNKKEIRKVEASNSRSRYINGTIGKVLGFKARNLDYSTHHSGQMNCELQPDKYLGIYVNTENSDDFKKIIAPSPDNGTNGAFAIVPLNRHDRCYDLNQVVDNRRFIKTFNPPIHFNKIKIQYKTIEGHAYDFNGIDNYLVFEIKQVFGHEKINNLRSLT